MIEIVASQMGSAMFVIVASDQMDSPGQKRRMGLPYQTLAFVTSLAAASVIVARHPSSVSSLAIAHSNSCAF